MAELVLSMTIMSLLLGAATSAMLIASHAMPETQSDREAVSAARQVLEHMAEDLLYATQFSRMETKAVEFQVGDRGHGAAGPETVLYTWDKSGKPLMRTYNNGTPVEMVGNVGELLLTYHTEIRPGNDKDLSSITVELQVGSNAANAVQIEVRFLNGIKDDGSPHSG